MTLEVITSTRYRLTGRLENHKIVGAMLELTDGAIAIDVEVSGAPGHGVLMSGVGARWIGGKVHDCGQNGFALRGGASHNEVSGALIYGNKSFGVHMDEESNRNLIERCRGTNRLELIGVRVGCWGNRLLHNVAESTTDNGISVTGDRNLIQGNICRNNGHSGIGLYGSRNVVICNLTEGNGTSPYAGVFVKADFGGSGSENVIDGNMLLDQIGINLRAGSHTLGNVIGTNHGTTVIS